MAQKVKISVIRNWAEGKISEADVPLEVKKYLPIRDKMVLVNIVVDGALEKRKNSVTTVNYPFQRMIYDIELLRAYTNIDFSFLNKCKDAKKYFEKLTEFYDLMVESGIMDKILNMIPTEEKVFIKYCIDKQLQEEQNLRNSLPMMIGYLIDVINEKLPEMEETIKNFKPEDFKFIAEGLKLNNNIS